MLSKKTKFIKFFIVKMQKGRHIRKAQSMSNLFKKRSSKKLMKRWSSAQNKKGLFSKINQKSIFLRFMPILISSTENFCYQTKPKANCYILKKRSCGMLIKNYLSIQNKC